jgi:hypothetical protein
VALRLADVATGRCLCGAVSYRVDGELEPVVLCHCEDCRRWHGHIGAFAAAARDRLAISDDGDALRWYAAPTSDARARRGFCARCGSSLFWDAPDHASISIAAGSLDAPTGVRVVSHWFASRPGDYYDVPDDGLPHHGRSGAAFG